MFICCFFIVSYFLVFLYFQTFLPQTFGLLPPRFQKKFLYCSKMKFTALASRASGTSLSYTRVFNSICWHQACQFPLSTLPFTISSGFIIWHRFLFANNHPIVIAVNLTKVPFVLGLLPLQHRKEPLETQHLRALVEKTDLNDLLQLRNVVMFVVTFSGFLRFS